MAKAIDVTGRRFGRLVAEEQVGNLGRDRAWSCKCDCGNQRVVRSANLRRGATRSCGCLRDETTSQRSMRHGHSRGRCHSPTYNTWRGMIDRCGNPSHVGFARYGARGIMVCQRWLLFSNFLADMGERPSSRHSIDRIDCDRGYEPGNCRWATVTEQSRNRAFCKLTPDLVREIHGRVEHGETMAAVARRMKLGESTVNNIIAGRSWRDIYAENR